MSEFTEIQEYEKHLMDLHAQRVKDQDEYEADYLMDWPEEGTVRNKMRDGKIVKSPDIRNRIQGSNRLLSSTDPAFTVPAEMNTEEVMGIAGELEKMGDRIFRAASRVATNPIHYDVALSLNLFGETHILITRTADMLAAANQKDKNIMAEAEIYRAEEIARITPFMLDVVDPRVGFPDIDRLGLRAYSRVVDTTAGAVLDEFGKAAVPYVDEKNRWASATLHQLFTWKRRYVWLGGSEDFIYNEDMGLPFIPVVVQLGEGSMMFEDPENQRQPLGFTVSKSGLSSLLNLSMTVAYTMLFKLGTNPQWTDTASATGEHAVLDFSIPGGRWMVEQGGSLVPVDLRQVVNPVLLQMQELAQQKVEESTIFSQTLGAPLAGDNPYSTVALLHHAGRLPLIMPQKKGGWAIADAVKKCMIWLKKEPPQKASYSHILGDLKIGDIPDHFEIEAHLKVDLPQDEVQNAKVAQGLRGLVSDAWLVENLLSVGQPDEMKKAIWSEQASNMTAEMYFTDMLLRLEMMKQQLQAIKTAQVTGQPGGQQGGQPGGQQGGTGTMPAETPPPEPMVEPGAEVPRQPPTSPMEPMI